MLQPESLLNLPQGASQPQFSPDVALIAYVENGNIWVTTVAAGGVAEKLGPGANPQWHPDGWLSFLREQDGVTRIWRYDVTTGAEPTPLPPEELSVGAYAWSPDGLTLAVFEGRALQRPQVAKPGAIWLLEAESGKTLQRIEPPAAPQLLLGSPAWSPDSQQLAWSVAVMVEGRRAEHREVRLLSVADGAIQSVLPVGACQTSLPAWRTDGKVLALAATPHPYGYHAFYSLATWNLRDASVRYRTHDPFVLPARSVPLWSPDGQSIYVTGNYGAITRQIFAVSLADGAIKPLTDGISNHKTPVLSADGRWLASVVEVPDQLTEIRLVATDGSESRQLTQANQQLACHPEVERLDMEVVRWPSLDGLEVEGMLLYPPGYGPHRPPPVPLPTIVDPHGGPKDITPRRTLGDDPLHFTTQHFLAAQGYLCFSPDYRSSGIYGWEAYQQMLTGHDNNIRLNTADIMAGVDHLIAAGLADPTRLGLRGHSHGASLANWLITQTNRFAAAVSVEGPTNLVAAAQATVPNDIAELEYGGSIEDVPENYRANSPLTYAAQARTPLLLFEGEPMKRMEQGKPFCAALEAVGVEVEYVYYAGEGHTFRKPENQADYLRRMVDWFDRHLRGTEKNGS
jgi:dipeptidyl aminopeptidase/acylaminoacyl peptidase